MCVKILKWLFPEAEKKRMDYRYCLSYIAAHLDDMRMDVKKMMEEHK